MTWLLGWWGFPWGFIYSPHAIFVNLFGGQQPHSVNARLAAYQAWAFAVLGKMDMARAIVLDALDIARKIRPEHALPRRDKPTGDGVNDEGARLRKEIWDLISILGAGSSTIRLKNSWSLLRRPFFIQVVIGLTAIGLVGAGILNDKPSPPPPPPSPTQRRMGPALHERLLTSGQQSPRTGSLGPQGLRMSPVIDGFIPLGYQR
jgi:hypothetical protein